MDRFSKACLLLIVLFLAVIALRPFVAPPAVHAAPPTGQTAQFRQYSYLIEGISRTDDMEATLTKLAGNGWQVVGMTCVGQYNNQVLFIIAR
jgi:hypothetical protein